MGFLVIVNNYRLVKSMNEKEIKNIVKESLALTLKTEGLVKESTVKPAKAVIKEAVILSSKPFVLKTESQSNTTKENHFQLYKSYVESFNKISSKLDTVDKISDPTNTNDSEFRRLKQDEQHNLNGAKLHELYFDNISDLASNIGMDSVPFMRLSRDWGSFENWQFDFRACGLAAREGWAILYWEPFKQRYLNCFVEKHSEGVPVGGIPVLVVDTWHHAWFRDYPSTEGKINFLHACMREINWNVVEARMQIAEQSNVHQIFLVKPVANPNTETQRGDIRISNVAPIDKSQVTDRIQVGK